MCDFNVCRICLRNDSKFYRIDEYDLKIFYETLTSLTVNIRDGLPQYFCYECAALLYKYNQFKEKCNDGHNVLMEMFNNGPITYAGISEINVRKIHKCQKNCLEILSINDRVKTCSIQHTQTELSQKNDNSEKLKEEISLDLDCSDSMFSDGDDFEFNDPESDPVAEEIEVVDMKVEEDNIVNENKETIPDIVFDVPPIATMSNFDVKPEFKPTAKVESLKEECKKEPKPEKEVKKKSTKKRIKNKAKKKKIKQKYDSDFSLSSGNDSDSEILSKVKAKKASKAKTKKNASNVKAKRGEPKFKSKKKRPVIPPESAEGYKFNKPKSAYRNLAFLDSGFWRKSNFTEEEAMKNFELKAQDKKYLKAAYKCTDCFRGFSQLSMLERHIPQRHGEAVGKLICLFCKMRFKSKYRLCQHMRQHYSKYECLRCDLVCSLETSALFHEEYHNGVIRKCPHCNKEYKHLSTFYTHLRTHRSKHMCSLCGESFVSELGLRLHKKAKHLADSEPPSKFMEENSYCDVCQIKFETRDAYDKHFQHSALHTGVAGAKMNLDDLKNLLDDDVEKDENGEMKDSKAEELHRRRSQVEKTLSAVRKNYAPRKISKKPTTCNQCGRHFDTQSACVKHHRAVHPRTSFFSPKDRVICEICGISLAPGSVTSHLNQHTRAKMFTCDTCGRSFTTSTMLRTHLVTHTGEKRYGCTLCDKRFTQNGSLSLHYRTFHLRQPYPKRNRRKKIDNVDGVNGKEEI